jgi:hypothetical protein
LTQLTMTTWRTSERDHHHVRQSRHQPKSPRTRPNRPAGAWCPQTDHGEERLTVFSSKQSLRQDTFMTGGYFRQPVGAEQPAPGPHAYGECCNDGGRQHAASRTRMAPVELSEAEIVISFRQNCRNCATPAVSTSRQNCCPHRSFIFTTCCLTGQTHHPHYSFLPNTSLAGSSCTKCIVCCLGGRSRARALPFVRPTEAHTSDKFGVEYERPGYSLLAALPLSESIPLDL